jgi:coenzyme PQQ biosynthesis protein PqqD
MDMSKLAENRPLGLAPGCRIDAREGHEELLLIPEGALRLAGPARDILELCNGERALGEIVQELRRRHPSEDARRIETETVEFLEQMVDRGVVKCA